MQGYNWQGGEGGLPLFWFCGTFSLKSQDEGIDRMPVSLTDDTSLAGAVSIAETRIRILNYCSKLKKLSEKEKIKQSGGTTTEMKGGKKLAGNCSFQ